ncbi:NDR1/HIN1-like protein 12 [Elaeis guineensis]|uniref:NDR1/HIN1-like protein 12 n=1 Tax=Elaeis guineensis var. tenera TaxID=51953 RepID=A0A6I9SFB0_ELAGV|nr:NDR1/HIN1-like protein 12 [Elaeis guineensis]
MSAKDGDKSGPCKRANLFGGLFACLLSVVILILFVIFIIWLVLRPSKPNFLLQDATITQFDLSEPNFLSTTIQITISSRNPNDRIGIYYDRLDVFVDYRGQRITDATALPPGYQGHDDVTIWSPYLYGAAVPIASYLADAVHQDQTAGFFLLYIKIDGNLRWKVGTWISGHYHIHVNCPAFFTVDAAKGVFQFQKVTSCSVDV